MKKIILCGMAATGVLALAGCASNEPVASTTTTTEESTSVQPAPTPAVQTTTTTVERTSP